MNTATAQQHFQQWLADINHACGEFDGAALGMRSAVRFAPASWAPCASVT